MLSKNLLYIGTYTEDIILGTGEIFKGKGAGIYLYRLLQEEGILEYVNVYTNIRNPSYLAFSPNNQYLYVVNELKEFDRKVSGSISAFSIDYNDGSIKFLNSLSTNGLDPCHLSVDDTGKFIFVANYMSGSVAVYQTGKDGRLDHMSDFVQHIGKSIDSIRQKGPHAHAVVYNPPAKHLYVSDLGLDRILVYRLDTRNGKLFEEHSLHVDTKPGAGPRYLEFGLYMNYAYLVNELDSTVTTLWNNKHEKKLVPIQTVSILPKGYDGNSDAADLHITPSGSFLYASNRGHDSIACFRIVRNTGMLEYIEHTSCEGRTPRNFMIDSKGNYIVVANQDSNMLSIFSIDSQTGTLKFTGNSIEVPSPVCVRSPVDI